MCVRVCVFGGGRAAYKKTTTMNKPHTTGERAKFKDMTTWMEEVRGNMRIQQQQQQLQQPNW